MPVMENQIGCHHGADRQCEERPLSLLIKLREIERGIAKLEKASKQYLYENTSSRITNTHFLQSTQQNMFYKGWYSELQSWAVELIVKYIRFAVGKLQCRMDNSLKDTFNFCWFVF